MGNYNRKCLLCGKEYEYCPSCSKDLSKPVWYRNFHEENCRTIFYILTDYRAAVIGKNEAAERLASCDLSHSDSWDETNREVLAEILSAEDKF